MKYLASIREAAQKLSSSADGRQFFDDSFWICDLGEAACLLRKWFSKLPRVRPYFAMKAAPHPELLKLLVMQGAGIDCASKGEIDLALKMGAKAEDIIYSNTNKQISYLLHAKQNNINLTVYDSEGELRKISTHHPESRLLLRLKVGLEEGVMPLSERFGATLSTSKRLLQLSKDLGLKTIGVSFHAGTACRDKASYTYALEESKKLFDYALTIGIKFEMLNMGGGFEGTEDTAEYFEEITTAINASLSALFLNDGYPALEIIAEPGRYFAESPFSLVANIIAKKEEDGHIDYTLNEGVCSSFWSTIAGRSHGEKRDVVPVKNKQDVADSPKVRFYGPTSGSFDLIKKAARPDLEIGEWILWQECGAYTFALVTNFNGFAAAKIYNIVTEKSRKQLDEKSLQLLVTLCDGTH